MIIDIDPRVDVVFHNLFGSPEHPTLTRSFVNALLARSGLPTALELTIQNPFQLADFMNQKESHLDILMQDETRRQVQLEMQIRSRTGLPQRMLHNWSQVYQRQLRKSQHYYSHCPVLSAWILEQPLFDDGRWRHLFRCRDTASDLVLHEDLGILTTELAVWRRSRHHQPGGGDGLDPLDKWLYFLSYTKGAEQDGLLATLDNPEFEEAVEVVNGFTKEENRRIAYDRRKNWEILLNTYIEDGKQEGIREGRLEGKLEDARAMLAEGLALDLVLRCTGLTAENLKSHPGSGSLSD